MTLKKILSKKTIFVCIAVLLLTAIILFFFTTNKTNNTKNFYKNKTETNTEKVKYKQPENKNYIKWVEFDITYKALYDAMNADIKSQEGDKPIDWIHLLACLGTKYGGDFSKYKQNDMNDLINKINNGEDVTQNKYYSYYIRAYDAVLRGLVGQYTKQIKDENGNITWKTFYGLRGYSPIAEGYSFNHYDDFGASRSYGFARRHLGHDIMGSIGTPIVAIENGYIESLGWNQYGGWRIGIRSTDGRRYYYYAHLRKDHPYVSGLKEGDYVHAGDVIGYLGMTGYSTKENVNNINVPHLHLGIQLIFDESQKDGNNEIWIDCYNLTKLLSHHKSTVIKDKSGEYKSLYKTEISEE